MAEAPSTPGARTLIFGGTFDPPHLAHAQLPALAAAQLGCDEILYIPAAINPLKSNSPPLSKEHRLAMLLLAIADVPNSRISAIELDRPPPSYTIDTLRELQNKTNTHDQLYLLIGCDQALHFHEWKDWQQILTLATPAVMVRPPWTEESFSKELHKKYSPVEAEQWQKWTLRLPRMDISATEIRNRLAQGESAHGMLDPVVEQYIRVNKLYS